MVTATSNAAAPDTRSSRRRPPDRKASIVEAAAALFAAEGFASVGIDDIAAAVGVTGPAIYRHFAGKEAILAQVVLATVSDLASRTVAAAGAEGTRESLVADAVGFALDHPDRLATYLRERARLPADVERTVTAMESDIYRAWSDRLQRELPALDHRRVVVRERAAIGALSVATLRRTDAEPSRVRSLLSTGVLAMVTRPPVADSRPVAQRAWEPPVSRRQELLAAALTLFRQRGFRGVGIDEIGEAVGITGSAVYRHFDAKVDILVDAYDQAGARVAAGVEVAVARATSPVEALGGLVGSYAQAAVDNVDLIVVTSREAAALPAGEQSRFTRRRRALRDLWVAVLRQARAELSEPEARLVVATTLAVVNSGAGALRPSDRLGDELAALALTYSLGST